MGTTTQNKLNSPVNQIIEIWKSYSKVYYDEVFIKDFDGMLNIVSKRLKVRLNNVLSEADAELDEMVGRISDDD